MMLLKIIGTLIVVTQLVTSLPMDKNDCNQKRKLCGKSYDDVLVELCLGNKYSNCPMEDDITMPKFKYAWQVAEKCCKIGCKASYLKYHYCKTFLSHTTDKYDEDRSHGLPDLRKIYPPTWSEFIWGLGLVPNEWPFYVYPEKQQQPLDEMKL